MNKNNDYFYLRDFFTPIRGKRLTKNNRVNGTIPFVTAGKFNNGISEYISNNVQLFENKLTIDMFCNCFYQQYKFSCDDNILVLNEKEEINDACKIYLSKIISLDNYRYQYGRQYRLDDFKKHKIKLPSTSAGDPDWEYMEYYIKSLNIDLPKTKNRELNNKLDVNLWQYFSISSIFSEIKSGKVYDTSILDEGTDIYYIGAKKENNGVIKQCKLNSDFVSKGNCVVFICDGQGSIGYNNYMPCDFMGTVNLALGYSKFLNKYIGLFLVTVLDKERFRFSFGRKRKATLKDTLIKLPVTPRGEPDWQFMEEYIKSLPYGDCI